MPGTFVSELLHSFVFRIAVLFLVLSMLAYVAMTIATTQQQALTPGEKSLGVGALAMTFALPLVFFGTLSLGCLLYRVAVVGYRRFLNRGLAPFGPSSRSA